MAEVGRQGGGTLGGFVCLTIGDQEHRGFLTSHRVIRSDAWNAEEVALEARFGHGSKECRSIRPTAVQHPAHDVYPCTKLHQFINRKWIEKQMEELTSVSNEARETGRSLSSSRTYEMDCLEKDLHRQAENEALTAKLPLQVGTVLFSSGNLVTDDKLLLDWAFIKFPDTISCPPLANRLLDSDLLPFTNNQPRDYQIKATGYCFRKDKPNPL